MQTPDKTIDHSTLRRLVDAGAHVGAEVVGGAGGWGVVISYGRASQPLAATRGAPRTWRRFETLAGYLKELGIVEYRVNTAEFAPGAAAGKPDDKRSATASDRMKRAHQASTAAAVAVKVFMKASTAELPASSAEPALKPNQPTHSSEAPTMVCTRLCGGMASLP